MLDVTNDDHRHQIARLVLARLPGAESLTAASVLVIFRENGSPAARWCGKAALRSELAVLLVETKHDVGHPERLRALAEDIIKKLELHTALVPVLFLVRGGRILLDLWPPSEILAARGLS